MELIDGLQKHQRLQQLLEKVERRINEKDPDDAALNMRKILEYITTEYMKEYAQQLVKEDLCGTINGLERSGILSREIVSLFHKIRMAGNASGAHFKEKEGSLQKTQSLYKQLLAYIPSFLEDFPEPSKKEVSDNPFDIDYMSITPLQIDFPDYKKRLDYDSLFPANPPEDWYPEGELRDSIDSLSWLFNDERYLYRNNGKLYVNRFQLVIDTVNRIQRFLEMGYDDSRFAEPNYIHVPAIVQEYFNFSYVIYNSVEETIQGPNGIIAKTGRYKGKGSYADVEAGRIINELAAFQKNIIIPDCVTKIDKHDYIDISSDTEAIYLPTTMIANQTFAWLRKIPIGIRIYMKTGEECLFEGNVIYTRDKKKILYATSMVPGFFRVPDEVQCIGEGAFKNTKIRTIFLNNVKRIESEAFAYCKYLKNVLHTCQLSKIGENAFKDCKELETSEFTAIVNNGATRIESGAFEGCPEPKGELPDKSYTFKNSFQLKPTGRTIGVSGLSKEEKEKITELIIPEGITHISGYDGIQARRIIFPSTLTSIENKTTTNPYLEEVNLPDGVRSIGSTAFKGFIRLKKVRIPDTVKEIYITSFQNCICLEEVEVPERFRHFFKSYPNVKFTTPEPPSKEFLEELDKQFIRYQDTKTFHQTCDNFTNEMLEKVRQKIVFKAVYPLREPKVCIDYDKLPDKSYALKVDIPSDATKDIVIDIKLVPSFRNMYTELIIPEGLLHCPKGLGRAFCGLRRIIFPSTLISIDTEAFCDSRLQEVYLPDGVISIGEKAFRSSNQLKRLRIPNTVGEIYESSFENCPSLEEVDVPERYRYLFEDYPNVKFTTIEPPSKRTIIEQNEQPIQNQNIENTHQTDTSSVKEVAKETEQPHIEEKSLSFFQKLKNAFSK